MSRKRPSPFFHQLQGIKRGAHKMSKEEDVEDRRILLVIQNGRAYEVPVGENYVLPAYDDEEERMRLGYELEELRQDSEKASEEEELELSPTNVSLERREEVEKENNKIIRNKKRPKEETGREKWERRTAERESKAIKRAVQMAKKLKKQGKMKSIDSYFNK